MSRKILSIILSFILIVSAFPHPCRAQNAIKLWVEGNYLSSDTDAFILNGRTMVPLRVISEHLGFQVQWNATEQTILISPKMQTEETTRQILRIGSMRLTREKNGDIDHLILDAPPLIKNSRTFVPVRAIAETFHLSVGWDRLARTVHIGEGYKKTGLPPYPIIDKVSAESDQAQLRTGINPQDPQVTYADLYRLATAEVAYLDEVHRSFLRHLQEDGVLEPIDADYLGWTAKRKKYVEKELEGMSGTMARFNETGLYRGLTLNELNRLSQKYYHMPCLTPDELANLAAIPAAL